MSLDLTSTAIQIDGMSADLMSRVGHRKGRLRNALRALEQIVRRLESGDVPLDESIALYAKGEELRKRCADRVKPAP